MKTIKTLQNLFRNSPYKVASLHACAACYYLLLSAVPALAFFLLNYYSTPMLQADFSSDNVFFLYNVFKTNHPSFTSILNIENIILWLWSASKGIWSISKGFDAVLNRESPQSFLKKRLISVLHFIILNICLILMLFVAVFGRQILPFLGRSVLAAFIENNLLSSHVILTTLFSLYYYLHSGSNIRLRFCMLGATLAAIGWILVSSGFSVYINCIGDQTKYRNILSILVLLAVWLRICIIILFAGIKYADFRQNENHSFLSFLLQQIRTIHE